MILLASTMDGLDLSRSRVMVAAVQSLAFYCFPLLTGLLLHVMRNAELVKLFVFGVCFINKVPFVRGMRPRVGRGPVSSWSSCAPR